MELADQLSPGQWRPTSLAPVPALSPAERAVEQTSPSHAHSCPAHFSLRFAPHVGCPCKIFCSQKTAAVSSRVGSTAAAVWGDSSRAEKEGLFLSLAAIHQIPAIPAS